MNKNEITDSIIKSHLILKPSGPNEPEDGVTAVFMILFFIWMLLAVISGF